jgi:small-conductance mechanosensitive channel
MTLANRITWLRGALLSRGRAGGIALGLGIALALALAVGIAVGTTSTAIAQVPATAGAAAAIAPEASSSGGDAAVPGLAGPAATRATGVALVVMNRSVVRLHATFFGMSPAERVEAAQRRIHVALAAGGERRVGTQAVPQGTAVTIDGAHMFVITPADVEQGLGQSASHATAALAGHAVSVLEQVVAEWRESRDGSALLVAAGWAAGATAIFAFLFWGLLRARDRVAARLAPIVARHARANRAEQVVRGEWLLELGRGALRVLFWAVALLLAYEWATFVLTRFPYSRPWGEELNGFLLTLAGTLAGGMVGAVPGLLVALAIFVVARFLWQLIARFLDRVQAGTLRVGWLDAEFVRPTRRILVLVYWLFVVAMVYPYLPGSQSDAFKGISVLVGLMVSLGASNLVGQAASGIVILFSRMYRPGDYVQVGENEGTVTEIGTFTTRLRTGMGDDLVLPNSLVLASANRNYSRAVAGRGFILAAKVSIGYDTPWRQVNAMLVEAARRTAGIATDPAPRVYQTNLADFYVEYQLSCHALLDEPAPRAAVIDRLNANIQDVFNEHGVQIMSPHYLADPAAPKVVPPERWHAAPAAPPSMDRVTVTRVPSGPD